MISLEGSGAQGFARCTLAKKRLFFFAAAGSRSCPVVPLSYLCCHVVFPGQVLRSHSPKAEAETDM